VAEFPGGDVRVVEAAGSLERSGREDTIPHLF
jgi:hypothetical protein